MQKNKYCSHINSGDEAVLITNCGGYYCPICNQVWTVRKEEVEEIVNKILNQIQSMDRLNNINGDRQFASMTAAELANRFPDLLE